MRRRTLKPVTIKDESSGMVHIRVIESIGNGRGKLAKRRELSDERCQKDQAGDSTVLPRGGRADRGDGVPIGYDLNLLCEWCFPNGGV